MMWFVIRLTGWILGIPGRPPAGTLLVSLLILTLMWLRIRSSRERILYANLAISSASISMVVAVVTASLEILAWIFLGPVLSSGGTWP